MKKIGQYFVSGLLFLAPVVITIYVVYLVFNTIDGIFDFGLPGAGFLFTLSMITFVGFVASHLLTAKLLLLIDRLFSRLPLIALLYNSLKDLANAFVGDKKSFNRPVEIALDPDRKIRILGFITQDELQSLGLNNSVAVYVPQSYNFAGNLVIVDRERITPLTASPRETMKLIVSGGVVSTK